MDLTHTFTVPVDVEEAWAHFNDIAEVAQCFPGAQVTAVENDTFNGSVKVKLGPIALQYNGSGTFVEKDDDNHRFVVDAKGKDKRGNGTAGAKVTLSMVRASATSTAVEVLTDLAITGKPAQFGRGVMQDVSDKLLGQFVACLESRLSAAEAAAGDSDEPPGGEPVEAPQAQQEATAALPPKHAADVPTDSVTPPPVPHREPRTLPPPPPRQDEALDLGATVLPVLVKSYWKQALGGLVVLLVLRRLLRR
ncbi:MAG: SRPBCC domain-containing protein [Nocardioides sp.]|jgi:carbon monoxide dehydrogenase subunit G